MESQNEPTEQCENCGRDIAESKMPLHEAYCIRNVIRCPKCNDPVDKAELKDHEEQMHKLAPCKYCKKDFEVRVLEAHQDSCTKKPKFCEFCNCDVGAEEYANHKYMCGSRTRKCSYCNKNIMIRDFDAHEPVCAVNQQNYDSSFPSIKEEQKVDKPKAESRSKPTQEKDSINIKANLQAEPERKKPEFKPTSYDRVPTTSTTTTSKTADIKNKYSLPERNPTTSTTTTSTNSDIRNKYSVPERNPTTTSTTSQTADYKNKYNLPERNPTTSTTSTSTSTSGASNRYPGNYPSQITSSVTTNIGGTTRTTTTTTNYNKSDSLKDKAGSGYPSYGVVENRAAPITTTTTIKDIPKQPSINKPDLSKPTGYRPPSTGKASGSLSGHTTTTSTSTNPKSTESYSYSKSTSKDYSKLPASNPSLKSHKSTDKKTKEEMDALIAKQLAEGGYEEEEELSNQRKPSTKNKKPSPQGTWDDYETYNDSDLNIENNYKPRDVPRRQASDMGDEDEMLQRALQASLKDNRPQPRPQNTGANKYAPEVIEDYGDDPELQRAIQESLKASGADPMRDTWSDPNFKRALENSRKQK